MTTRAVALLIVLAACGVVRFDPSTKQDAVATLNSDGQAVTAPDAAQGLVFSCPMDPEIRAHNQGTCRKCGMRLVAGVPDPVEFHVDLATYPAAPSPRQPAVLQFVIREPWKNRAVRDFNVVHEKLFHAFVVSEDLQFFEHGHPQPVADGTFQYPIAFPHPGLYRVLADFYPAGATPQLASQTVIVSGTPPAPIALTRDYAPKQGQNVAVSMITIPPNPSAGNRTQVRLTVEAPRGLQQYLGAWAHMLGVSGDLIDMMHEHPSRTDGGSEIDFDVVFPRPGAYRLWIQVQSSGTVNTVHFDVPVRVVPERPEIPPA